MFGGALDAGPRRDRGRQRLRWGTWKTVFTQGPSRSPSRAARRRPHRLRDRHRADVPRALLRSLRCWSPRESQTVVWPALGDVVSRWVRLLVIEMWALIATSGTLARAPPCRSGSACLGARRREPVARRRQLLGPVEAFTKILPGTAALAGGIQSSGPADRTTPASSKPCRAARRASCCSATSSDAAADRLAGDPAANVRLTTVTRPAGSARRPPPAQRSVFAGGAGSGQVANLGVGARPF